MRLPPFLILSLVCVFHGVLAADPPAYLETRTDEDFGSKVTRITGDPGTVIPVIDGTWGEVVRHGYSKEAVWNADQSLLLLRRNEAWPVFLFLDGTTYAPLFGRNDPPGVECRWHPERPDEMVWVNGDTLGFWNVREHTTEVIATFPGYSDLHIGPWEGNLSVEGKRIALAGTKDGNQIAFAYDIAEKKKYPDLDLSGVTVDWVSISYSGKFLVVNGRLEGDTGDQSQVYDLDGKKVGKPWLEYGRPSHYDLTVDENGEDIAVGVSKSKPDDGRVIKRRLSDGKVTVLTPSGYASHVSTRNTKRPGWAYATYQQRTKDWPPYVDEVVAIKLDGSMEVQRIAHMHTINVDYLSEAHACPSPDGKRVLWTGSWDDPKGRPLGVYVAELPDEMVKE